MRDVIANKFKSLGAKIFSPFTFHRSQSSNSPFTIHHSPFADSKEEFWALRDVSFEIKQGDRVGIIGRNGAGKTTLLKLLSRITEPTTGRIELTGRVASLLEVGTGFHPELTGRENIFLNGAILGMSKAEIKKKFDEIVAFAEIETFLDTPVKRYSSGMYVRLAFAVAAHLEPEILVVDEVLAVGDAQFQKKSLGKMGEVAKEGRTVLFVSHNMDAIQRLCTKALWLRSGEVAGTGEVTEQIDLYLNSTNHKIRITSDSSITLGAGLQLNRFEFIPNPVRSGEGQEFIIELWSSNRSRINAITVLIYSRLGVRIAILDLRRPEVIYEFDGVTTFTLWGKIESLPLVEGDYDVGLYIDCGEVNDNFLDLARLSVTGKANNAVLSYPPNVRGVVEMDYKLLN